MIEEIRHQGELHAIIIPSSHRAPGVEFFTPPEFSQQLGYMRHGAGHVIDPHMHNQVRREVRYTQEVLFIRRGRLRVNFYDEQRGFLESRELSAGDVVLLVIGGHGFEVIDEVEMVEVKQGPYLDDNDKTRFVGVEGRGAQGR